MTSRKDKIPEIQDNITNEENEEKIKPSVILERPIEKKEEDKFDVYPYVEQLKEACDKGAVFIAVDGKFGSGKSSIVKLFENDVKNDSNIFVNINFMNINSIPENKEDKEQSLQQNNINEDNDTESLSEESAKDNGTDDRNIREEELLVNDYHRYFVNQVINDICKNPYEFEKLFYNQMFSYTTINFKKRTARDMKNKYFIDRLLLFLISFVSIYTIYGSFFEDESNILHEVYNTINPFFPIILLLTFILLVLYGYGFYKPEKTAKSPMLDVDKCRNNFLKVINDYIDDNCTLYLIIDDLDRVKNKQLQLKIISLLFNEYYSLNNLINGVKLKFVFMIDIDKIKGDIDLQPKKMFDYILTVSSNQKNILKSYVKELILENDELSKIFDIKNYEYFVGIIVSYFKDMRDVKHLLNKILTKNIYLKSKGIEYNSNQLIIMSILTSILSEEKVASNIEFVLNKVGNQTIDDSILDIIKENVNSKIIDKNYYIYIYNFIDKNDLLSFSEESIFDIMVNTKFNYIDSEKIDTLNELLDSEKIRFNIIYDECYKYIGDNKKIILLGNKKYYNYMESRGLIDKNILKNSYLNNNIYNLYINIKDALNYEDRLNIINDLNDKFYNYVENNEKYDDFILSFNRFVKNLKKYILDFDLEEMLSVIKFNDELFNLFLKIKKDNHSIIYDLIADKSINVDSIKDKITKEFINEIRNQNSEIAYNVEKSILESKVSANIKLYIIANEEKTFDKVENIYNEFINLDRFYISIVELEQIMSKYGYSQLLDKYIIAKLDEQNLQKLMINTIKKYNFELSDDILNKINIINTKYGYSEYYENIFKNREYFELLIYSQAINNDKFKLDVSLLNNVKYKKSIFNVYKNMGKSFKNYTYTPGFINKIVNEMDFSDMNYDFQNFWKIDILIPSLDSYDKCLKVFERLKQNDKIGKYATYYKNNVNLKNLKFLERLSYYSSEMEISPAIKGNITKAISHVKERVH